MTRSRIRSASLAACLLLSSAFVAAPAAAQTNGVTGQGYTFQRQTVRPHRSADALPLATSRPRYIVEAIRLHADEETGPNWPGADEIVALFESEGHAMFTGIYGDFDDGETKDLRSAQRCMYAAVDPDNQSNHTWSCDPNGRAGAIDLTVTVYEFDGDLRNFFSPGFCIGSNDVSWGGCGIIPRSTAIGRYRQTFSEAELAAALPSVGASVERTMLVDNCSEAVTMRGEVCGYSTWMPSYAAYSLTYRVTRVADEIIPTPSTLAVQ